MAADDYNDLPSPHTAPCSNAMKSLHVVLLSGDGDGKLRGVEGGIFQYNWSDVPGDGRAAQRFALHGCMAGLGGTQLSPHQLVDEAPRSIMVISVKRPLMPRVISSLLRL
eukprot:1359660-Amphidinium_carterae.2